MASEYDNNVEDESTFWLILHTFPKLQEHLGVL